MVKDGYFLTKLLGHLNKSALIFSLDVADSCCSALHTGISYFPGRFGSLLHEAVNSFGEGFYQGACKAQDLTQRGFSTLDLAVSYSNGGNKNEQQQYHIWEVFKSVTRLVAPLTVVSPIVLMKAVLAISDRQTRSGKPYPPLGEPLDLLEHRRLVDVLTYRYRQTLAAYDGRVLQLPLSAGVSHLMGVSDDAILVYQRQSGIHRPAFVLIYDAAANEVSLLIRGSTEAADVMTDFLYGPDTELGFHSGMLQAARHIDTCVRDKIYKIIAERKHSRVVVGGHSLGGGVAALLAYLWQTDSIIGDRLECYSFGAPCVVPPKVAEGLRGVLTSVIYGRDIVSRFNLGSLTNLQKLLLQDEFDNINPDSHGFLNSAGDQTISYKPNSPISTTTTTTCSTSEVYENENDMLLLCPGGRTLLLVPLADLQKASRSLPEYLTPGGCAVFDLTENEILELVREPLLHPGALSDHFPHRLAAALGFFVPNN